jgi:hypothetical protein
MESYLVLFIGAAAGSILTFGYVARIMWTLYCDLIRDYQAAIREYQHAKKDLFRDAD